MEDFGATLWIHGIFVLLSIMVSFRIYIYNELSNVSRTTTIPIFQFSMDFTTKLDPANFKKIVVQSGIQSRNKFMSSVILNVVLLTSFHIKLDRLFSLVTKGRVN